MPQAGTDIIIPESIWARAPASRRALIGAALALPFAGAPLAATAAARTSLPNPDSELIDLCDRIVAIETEMHHLHELDIWAPDYGPHHDRWVELEDEGEILNQRIWEQVNPETPEGVKAVARATMVLLPRDYHGIPICRNTTDYLLAMLAQTGDRQFSWPLPSRGMDAALARQRDGETIPMQPPLVEDPAPAEEPEDHRDNVSCALKILGVVWNFAQRHAEQGGLRLGLDDIRAAGLPIPDLLCEVVPA